MRIHLVVGLMACTVFMLQSSKAFVFIDPSNLVQNTATAMNTANQVATQAKQLQAELKDMENYKGGIGQWANAQHFLYQLASQVEQGQALAYQMGNLDSQYRNKFPGYVPPTNYQEAYRNWAQTTHDTLLSTLASAGMQAAQFSTEQSQLNELSRLSRTAEGRMQAVQVGNMIATQQVSQLQALRQLVITQINAQNTYAAYQTQKEETIEASTAQWISASHTPFPVYGKNHANHE